LKRHPREQRRFLPANPINVALREDHVASGLFPNSSTFRPSTFDRYSPIKIRKSMSDASIDDNNHSIMEEK
jgi:hypothetical protein